MGHQLKKGYISKMNSEREEFDQIIILTKDLETLGEISASAKIIINRLMAFSSQLMKELDGLREENPILRERLEKIEYGRKTSENSSLPPALDPNRKRGKKSTLCRSGKNPGGQKGRKGVTLKKVKNPDKTIKYDLKGRCKCGQALSNLKKNIEERQVFELEIKRIVTSHQAEVAVCGCGLKHKASFAPAIKAPVQYGQSVQALSSYLSQYQLIPYERVEEIFKDLFGLSLSKGTVVNHIDKMAISLRNFTPWAKKNLLAQSLLHVDETTTQVKKNRFHIHGVSSKDTTLLEVHKGRGKEAVKSMGIIPRFKGKLVHDCYAMYFNYPGKDIICNAHLQRELDYFCTTEKYVWAQKMKIYLYSLFLEVNYLKSFGETKRHHTEFKFIRKKYKKLLREAQAEMAGLFTKERKNEKVVNLYNRLKKYELEILSFAKNYEVPFTNNQIERDFRMSKVHLKISGCFRSESMARNWSLMRSFISTLKKRQLPVFESIKFLADPYQKAPIYSILGPPT